MNILANALTTCLLATGFMLISPTQATAQQAPAGVAAGQDAYSLAEQQRREAIVNQRLLVEQARWYPYNYFGYAYPSYYPRKAYRQAVRYGYAGYAPMYPPMTRGPSDFLLGYPYYGAAKLPVGHEKIWTSPNGYIYRPLYPQSAAPHAAQSRRLPTDAPQVKPPEPPKPAPAAEAAKPNQAAEPIPAPPSEPGPREF
jgi:hypothetical protein